MKHTAWDFNGFQAHNGRYEAETTRVGRARIGRVREVDAGFEVCGLEVCGWESVTRFLKFLLVWDGCKLCGAGIGKNFISVQDSCTHKLPTEK